MKKIKRIVITSTALVLLSSGFTYGLCKNRKDVFNRYLKKYQKDEVDNFLICAHRGFSSLAVENTYQAINLASCENYVDFIEIDARMTKDGKIVLSHDNTILNNELEPVKVSDLTYDEAINMDFIYQTNNPINYFWYDDEMIMVNSRNQDLNNQEYHLIDLSSGLRDCGDKIAIVDLKFNNDIEKFTEQLKKEVIYSEKIIFQSLNIEGIKYLQDNSDFECMVLIDNKKNFKYIKDFKRVAIEKSLVTYDLIKELIDNKIMVAVWTINSTTELDPLLEEVAEYYRKIIYITNYPDLILTRVNENKLVKKKV